MSVVSGAMSVVPTGTSVVPAGMSVVLAACLQSVSALSLLTVTYMHACACLFNS